MMKCKFQSHGMFCTHLGNEDIRSKKQSGKKRIRKKKCCKEFCPLEKFLG